MKLSKYDAWVLARLRSELPVDGAVERVSASVRPLAEAMAGCPPAHLGPVFQGFLAGLVDRPVRAAFVRSIVDSDPMKPAPEPEAEVEADAGADLSVRVTCVADVEERPMQWLWDGRVPLGMLSLWAGAPKQGKSFVSLTLAAAVSRGAPMPMGSAPAGPASVVLMSAEDDLACTIKPRLRAAGADFSRIHAFESVVLRDGSEALPTLAADIARIAAVAERLGDCRLIIIDPVTAYLGRVDDHRNAELRGVLSPLKAVAEQLNLAVVLLSHVSKGGTGSALNRVIGSVAYVGACRANSLFVRDRSDPIGRKVLMLDNGGNLGAPAPALAYTIEDRGDGARVEWTEPPADITAEQALAAEQAAWQDQADAPERREAEEWLKEVLAEGPVPAQEIEAAAKKAGIHYHTLKRAKKAMRIASQRKGFGRDAVYHWKLA